MRDRFTQAVLSIDRSILRTEGAELDEILENRGFQNIIIALGVGICFDKDWEHPCFRLDRLRYGKIVVAMDESPEGRSIQSHVIGLLDRFMYPVVANGHVYTSPLGPHSLVVASEFANAVMTPATRILNPVT